MKATLSAIVIMMVHVLNSSVQNDGKFSYIYSEQGSGGSVGIVYEKNSSLIHYFLFSR